MAGCLATSEAVVACRRIVDPTSFDKSKTSVCARLGSLLHNLGTQTLRRFCGSVGRLRGMNGYDVRAAARCAAPPSGPRSNCVALVLDFVGGRGAPSRIGRVVRRAELKNWRTGEVAVGQTVHRFVSEPLRIEIFVQSRAGVTRIRTSQIVTSKAVPDGESRA
jgi:hypothetical protein